MRAEKCYAEVGRAIVLHGCALGASRRPTRPVKPLRRLDQHDGGYSGLGTRVSPVPCPEYSRSLGRGGGIQRRRGFRRWTRRM